ncbi:P-loop containing nucleoside triphosphate hydrolase protein [Biscogniauxia marginata]|nr:P-loop containing nucleoside triphosphate hydrolase protein [Biscogniauxia marginata]
MEDKVSHLVNTAWDNLQKTPKDRRWLIAIAGMPGSGKTTLSQILAKAINARHAATYPESTAAEPIAIVVPMDGFHLTRAQLSAMPDPAHAHARRGAEFTFDGAAFLALARAVREQRLASSAPAILAPSFDHAVKDPRDGDIAIGPGHRLVVFEGNYVCLDRAPWRDAAALMDARWFVDVDFAVARRRLVARHVRAGIAADEEEAARRADENDLVNGRLIVAERVAVDDIIESREDESWKHE